MSPPHIETYLKKLHELLPDHEGRFALVYDGEVVVFGTAEEANAAGYEKSGRPSAFLVMRISPMPASSLSDF